MRKAFLFSSLLFLMLAVVACGPGPERTALIPLDSRPCNTTEPVLLGQAAGRELLLPQEGLDYFTRPAKPELLWAWLETEAADCDELIIFTNELLNGGLMASRNPDSYEAAEDFIWRLQDYAEQQPRKKITVVTVLPRSLPSHTDKLLHPHRRALESWEEAIYATGSTSKLPPLPAQLPQEAADRFLRLYEEAGKLARSIQALEDQGVIDAFYLALDDHRPASLSLLTAQNLEKELGRPILHGGDEITSLLMARPRRTRSLGVIFSEPEAAQRVSDYETKTLESLVREKADFLDYVIQDQSKDYLLVATEKEDLLAFAEGLSRIPVASSWAIADVSLTNRGDPALAKFLGETESGFVAYSGWNTAANSIGSSLAALRIAADPGHDAELLADYRCLRLMIDQVYLSQLGPYLETLWRDAGLIDEYGVFRSEEAQERCTKELNESYQRWRLQYPYYPDVSFAFPWPRTFEVTLVDGPSSFS